MSIIQNNGRVYRAVAGVTVATVLTTIMAVAVAINVRPRSVPDLELVASQSSYQISNSVDA